jgi:hypothetical protein
MAITTNFRSGIKGIADEGLYRDVAQSYDLCFTRDIGFARNVPHKREAVTLKVLHVVLRQQRIELFLPSFLQAFENGWGRISKTVPTRLEGICLSIRGRGSDQRNFLI